MLRFLPFLALILLLACSKDRPVPVAPAGKAMSIQDALPAPTNLRIENLTATSVRFLWDAVEGATDYDVNYKETGGKWTNIPHRGTATHRDFNGLASGKEYRWAVKADRGSEKSKWAFGNKFSTRESYIRITFDGTLSSREKLLFTRAVSQWESLIVEGLPDGLDIRVSTDDEPIGPFVLGVARITSETTHADRQLPSSCSIHLVSMDSYALELVEEVEESFEKVSLHEIGHCLGIGTSTEWEEMVRYNSEGLDWDTSKEDSYTFNIIEDENGRRRAVWKYATKKGPSQPYFIGENAREEFLRLAENKWGDHPYVPLSWDRLAGSSTSHLDDILRTSIMYVGADLWTDGLQQISTLDAAIMQDLGYRVNENAEQVRLVAGFRDILRYYPDKGWANPIAREILYFPEWMLTFKLGEYDLKGYYLPLMGNTYEGDSTIREENLIVFFDDEGLPSSYAAKPATLKNPRAAWCGVIQ